MIKKIKHKSAGYILKPGSFTYMNRAMKYRSLTIQAIKNGNEYASEHYASLCACNARKAISIETRMLRHARCLKVRTFDIDLGFKYYYLSRARFQGQFRPEPL